MSDQIKDNCAKLVNLINKLDGVELDLDEFNKSSKFRKRGTLHSIVSATPQFSENFCSHWNEGGNLVIIEKRNNFNYLITLNPGEILFKVDNYSSDFKEAVIDTLRIGPWIDRFENYVENRIKEVYSLIEEIQKKEFDRKFSDIDF